MNSQPTEQSLRAPENGHEHSSLHLGLERPLSELVYLRHGQHIRALKSPTRSEAQTKVRRAKTGSPLSEINTPGHPPMIEVHLHTLRNVDTTFSEINETLVINAQKAFRYALPASGVVFNLLNYRVALTPRPDGRVHLIGTNHLLLVPQALGQEEPALRAVYLMLMLRTPRLQARLREASVPLMLHGEIRDEWIISLERLTRVKVWVPPLEAQDQTVARFWALEEERITLEKKRDTLYNDLEAQGKGATDSCPDENCEPTLDTPTQQGKHHRPRSKQRQTKNKAKGA